MNKRTRLIVSVLFAVIIILAAAITRFYVSVPDNMQSDSNQAEIVRTVETDGSGNIIFSDSNGKLGIADSVRITAVPEWKELKFAGDGRCIASNEIGGKLLCGCIDYEGNVVVPFIYNSITRFIVNGLTIYCAENSGGDSYVLYNKDFMPLFRQSWDSYDFGENEITLSDKAGVYVFDADSDGLIFRSASVSGDVMDCQYNLTIYSRVLLAKLSVAMIEKMTSEAEKYLEYAYTGNDELISGITSGNRSSFIPAFRNDNNIIFRKLLGISDIHIYSVSSENGIPRYDVSVNADTELIYYDESGAEKSLVDNYRISVKFSGNSESDLYAVSGKFELDSPVYPEPEPVIESQEQETTESE
ncbi:MAG: hypothetical protein NC340_01500 [Ruminococcus flavefaciens]|nr:hypothetical protein [Ruminococcus flavefaciens]MCM1228822.1 hypothetical protein [Ruminococcus flavefaciens]